MRFTGYAFLISGTILFGLMHLAIALYIPTLGSWSDPPGLLVTTLSQIAGWFPYILSILFMVVGIIFIVYDSEWWVKQMNEMKAREKEFESFMEEEEKR